MSRRSGGFEERHSPVSAPNARELQSSGKTPEVAASLRGAELPEPTYPVIAAQRCNWIRSTCSRAAKPSTHSLSTGVRTYGPALTARGCCGDGHPGAARLPLPWIVNFCNNFSNSNFIIKSQIKKGNHVSTAPTVRDHVAIRFHLSLFQRSLRGIPIPRHVDHDFTSGVPVQ